MKRRLIIVVVLLLVAGISAVLFHRFGNSRDEGGLSLSGNVEVTEVDVGSKMPGRVLVLYTDEGRSVMQGEKIAQLDSAEYASEAALKRAALRNAKAQLDKARKDYDRSEVLFQNGAVSIQERDAAKTAYDVAVAQTQQAEAALRTAEVRLKDTVLYAPVSGVVLRKNVETGETVAAGTPLFTIGDLDKPWIKVYVKEDKLGLVKLGQKAQVRTDTYPEKVYDGTVSFISSEAEFTPKNVQTKEERVKLVFGVKVSVRNINEELKPSMPADVILLPQE